MKTCKYTPPPRRAGNSAVGHGKPAPGLISRAWPLAAAGRHVCTHVDAGPCASTPPPGADVWHRMLMTKQHPLRHLGPTSRVPRESAPSQHCESRERCVVCVSQCAGPPPTLQQQQLALLCCARRPRPTLRHPARGRASNEPARHAFAAAALCCVCCSFPFLYHQRPIFSPCTRPLLFALHC